MADLCGSVSKHMNIELLDLRGDPIDTLVDQARTDDIPHPGARTGAPERWSGGGFMEATVDGRTTRRVSFGGIPSCGGPRPILTVWVDCDPVQPDVQGIRLAAANPTTDLVLDGDRLLVGCTGYYALLVQMGVEDPLHPLVGLAFGGSLISIFARLGGGIFTVELVFEEPGISRHVRNRNDAARIHQVRHVPRIAVATAYPGEVGPRAL